MNVPFPAPTRRTTFFSRLDFRAKLAVFCALTTVAVTWNDPRLSVALAVVTFVGCTWAGIAGSYLRMILRVMLPFFLLLLLTHGFFNRQHVLRLMGQAYLTPLFAFPATWPVLGGLAFSAEGFWYGINVIAKSLTLLLLVPLCVLTTDPNNLVVGLVRLRVPYKLAFAFSSTLRFFPLLFDEVRMVIEAQRLRGFVVEDMNALARVRTYAKVAVPVILGAMFKAQQIEVVLQARGFSGHAGRTYLHDSTLGRASVTVIALSIFVAVLVIVLAVGWHVGHFMTPSWGHAALP